MPTPREWTDRAADILLDERNKRYLGMTDRPTADRPQTAAGRAHVHRNRADGEIASWCVKHDDLAWLFTDVTLTDREQAAAILARLANEEGEA